MEKLVVAIFFVSFIIAGCSQVNNLAQLQPVPTPIQVQVPKVENNQVIGNYSTPIIDKRKSRLKNISLSINDINKQILQPGEIFSFNDTVGPRSKENGFEKAIIFYKGEKIMAHGGGICQVSTTIYNAALGAGLEIVERHEHEEEVQYIEKGKDATVSYDIFDLKIKNTKEYPIKIRVSQGKETIDASIITAR